MTELILNKIIGVSVIAVGGYLTVSLALDICKLRNNIKQLENKINKQKDLDYD